MARASSKSFESLQNPPVAQLSLHINDPDRYGVVELDPKGQVIGLRKPEIPKSNYAITGVYVYDNSVIDVAKSIRPSARGELEITDVNMAYPKGTTWR